MIRIRPPFWVDLAVPSSQVAWVPAPPCSGFFFGRVVSAARTVSSPALRGGPCRLPDGAGAAAPAGRPTKVRWKSDAFPTVHSGRFGH
jgi:hypothetical protein